MTERQIDYTALGLARAGVALNGVPYEYDDDSIYQSLEARLDIFTESVVLTRYGSDGEPEACYEVSPLDLAAAFAGLPVTTGMLPRDTLFYAESGADPIVGIYLEPQRRTLPLTDLAAQHAGVNGDEIEIPTPPLVFVGHGKQYRIYAVMGYPTDPATTLYHAPFPNVHPDGRICAGTADFPTCSPATIRQAAEAFFSSRFNTHLTNGKSRKNSPDVLYTWREIAESGAEEYPFGDMVDAYQILESLWA
jgi:hypothetical protein